MKSFLHLVLSAGMTVALLGCTGGDVPKVEDIQAPEADPIAEVKAILTNYSNGQPVTSEASEFPTLITRVKEKDPAKGAIVEKGLNERSLVNQTPKL